MPVTLEAGTIDGYCVGEPWNQQAVFKGIGVPVITDYEIWKDNPEKVFGVSKKWAEENPNTHLAVVKALIRAAMWLDENDNANRPEAVEILSRPEYVGADAEVIAASMALKWSMGNVYNAHKGDVYWAASDVGWVVGHSYIDYGPLLQGCTSIMFEGKPVGTPDAETFWRVIEEHKVNVLFTAPTAIRAIIKEDSDGVLIKAHDISSLKTLFLAGERADPDTIKWSEKMLDVPVIDNWWQTETGWPIASNPMGIEQLSIKYGSPCVAMPGYDVQVLDEAGEQLPRGELGAICIKLPLPPGAFPTLWNKDDRFKESYLSTFEGYYETADAGFIDEGSYISIMARTDDIINVAGHRLSTGGMEEVLSAHPDVAECAVVGIADQLKGQIPIGFIILKDSTKTTPKDIEAACVKLIRARIGAVAALRIIMMVKRRPKTRSGKILRGTIRKIADGVEWSMPATIDDPVILDEITALLKDRGLLS